MALLDLGGVSEELILQWLPVKFTMGTSVIHFHLEALGIYVKRKDELSQQVLAAIAQQLYHYLAVRAGLAKWLKRGPIPIQEVVKWFLEIDPELTMLPEVMVDRPRGQARIRAFVEEVLSAE
jgi:hypothetical protein